MPGRSYRLEVDEKPEDDPSDDEDTDSASEGKRSKMIPLSGVAATLGEIRVSSELVKAVFDRPDWYKWASCHDTDVHFTERGESTSSAKTNCASCAVQTECFVDGLMNKYSHGIVGGLSVRDMRLARKVYEKGVPIEDILEVVIQEEPSKLKSIVIQAGLKDLLVES